MELGLELDELDGRKLEELEELGDDRELEELVRELEDRVPAELADFPAALAIAAQICVIVAPSGTPRWRARANRRSTSRL